MHNDYALPRNLWWNERVPAAWHLKRLDIAQSKMIDGDNGGTWNPAAPIIIGGSGLSLTNTGGGSPGGILNGIRTGPKALNKGALILGVQDVPVYAVTRTRTIVLPVEDLARGQQNTLAVNEDDATAPGSITIFAGQQSTITVSGSHLNPGATIASIGLVWRATLTPPSLTALLMPAVGMASKSSSGTFTQILLNPPEQWTASTVKTTGDILGPTTPNGHAYRCTTAGTTNTSEPTWPLTAGSTVSDGSVVWTYHTGVDDATYARQPKATTVNGYYLAGSTQSFTATPWTTTTIDGTASYEFLVQCDETANQGPTIIQGIVLNLVVPDMSPSPGW